MSTKHDNCLKCKNTGVIFTKHTYLKCSNCQGTGGIVCTLCNGTGQKWRVDKYGCDTRINCSSCSCDRGFTSRCCDCLGSKAIFGTPKILSCPECAVVPIK